MRFWIKLALWAVVWMVRPTFGETDSFSPFRFESRHMGVDVVIRLYAADRVSAEAVSKGAFARIEKINRLLSDYLSTSEVRRLSAGSGDSEFVPISEELFSVLVFSKNVHEQSGGAFDPTVGPYVLAWRQARFVKSLPRPEKLARMRASVGMDKVELEGQTLRLTASGMRLDFGACAKGYAVDEALSFMRRKGIHRAFVDAGGDLAIGKAPPGKKGWKVAIENAGEVLELADCGVATSGDAYQFVEIDGTRFSHILDPRTGIGVTHRSQLTVIAASAMKADGWASALSVVGPGREADTLGSRHDLEVYWLDGK